MPRKIPKRFKRSKISIESRLLIASEFIQANPGASIRSVAQLSRLPKSTLCDHITRAKSEMLDRISARG